MALCRSRLCWLIRRVSRHRPIMPVADIILKHSLRPCRLRYHPPFRSGACNHSRRFCIRIDFAGSATDSPHSALGCPLLDRFHGSLWPRYLHRPARTHSRLGKHLGATMGAPRSHWHMGDGPGEGPQRRLLFVLGGRNGVRLGPQAQIRRVPRRGASFPHLPQNPH